MLSWEYPPHIVGGLGAHVAALAAALTRAGVLVQIVTPRWKGGEEHELVMASPGHPHTQSSSVHRINPPVMRMGNFFADVQQTNLNLEEQAQRLYNDRGEFDVIHAHDWLVAFAATSLKRLRKTPLLATIHATERGRGRGLIGGEVSQAINGTEWWLTYEAWRVIACSQYMHDEVRNYFNLPADKIDVVPNGVDVAPFDALDGIDLADFRKRWASPNERIVFNVGRVVQEKGAHLIVEAAPRVLAQMPNTKFVIAGTGAMVDQLKRRVWELGLSDQIAFAGFISDPDRNRLFKIADAAIYPSLYEPFGIAALEAMAAKCPVIVSNVGGLKEVVTHDLTGVMIQPDNVESAAWGILRVLQDGAGASARAASAYHIVKDEYNWDRIAEQTIEIYERIVHDRAKTKW